MVDQRNVTQRNLSHSWIRWTTGHGHSGLKKRSIAMVHYWVRHAKCTWSSFTCKAPFHHCRREEYISAKNIKVSWRRRVYSGEPKRPVPKYMLWTFIVTFFVVLTMFVMWHWQGICNIYIHWHDATWGWCLVANKKQPGKFGFLKCND